ncbi:macro domain-containing protein [Microscilla marina]|uniref:Appr-1-p processing enzyme family n=1 Tax=Microscilla marina ATCC 23134 TaxID=313606 RepID=A1ZG40_MICM2|nr:macro domain-containing protein [Microscilla marina]EAY30457.1 appr-1-p processing enzyme family [Microscilla marina ATCC 23134]
MAITFKKGGSLFDEDVVAIVNPVNTVGVMGKGLALEFKKRFPTNYDLYRAACKNDEVHTGQMFVTHTDNTPGIIVNFPTKQHWRGKSKLAYVSEGLDDLAKVIAAEKMASIALPPLGCGYGGLAWTEVKRLIEEKLSEVANDVEVIVFEP